MSQDSPRCRSGSVKENSIELPESRSPIDGGARRHRRAALLRGHRLKAASGSGGPARTCYDCHKEAKQKYGSKKLVHEPVAKQKCDVCHRSHGFTQKLVLQKPAE